jgi:uncharacterized SAM-binding protein YcdF (DUF218 family)
MTFRRSRRTAALLVAMLIVALVAGVPALRERVLRAAGWALVADDGAAPAEVIVVALDSGGAGVLEAADLVSRGIARRLAVFSAPPEGAERELLRRGVPYEDQAARQIRQLEALGVTDIVRIPALEDGTEGAGRALRAWCDERHVASIVLVASADHSRRTRRVVGRYMQGHPTRISVRPSRYSAFDPDAWWHSRAGVRTEIVEMQKLVLDLVLHPLSS